MTKRIVTWKPVRHRDIDGQESLDTHMPNLIAIAYRGELVDEILAMPKQLAISYEEAVTIVTERFETALVNNQIGGEREQSHWFHRNFVEFISGLGYHIELSGDELFSPSRSTN